MSEEQKKPQPWYRCRHCRNPGRPGYRQCRLSGLPGGAAAQRGGHMAQLDKTFPTLDCSACILTPKMGRCRRAPQHPLMTYAEPLRVDGRCRCLSCAGAEKSSLRRSCQVHGLRRLCQGLPGDRAQRVRHGAGDRRAIYVPFRRRCPTSIPSTSGLAAVQGAAGAHRRPGVCGAESGRANSQRRGPHPRKHPFPGVIGRVCNHPCRGGL